MVGIALVGIVVAVLAGAPDEPAKEHAQPTTTTTRRPRTGPPRVDRTTTTVRAGPLLGEPTGLLLTSGHNVVIDLDTGERIRTGVRILGGHAGRLLVDNGAGLAWWPAPFDGSGAEVVAERLSLDQVWIDDDDGTIWGLDFASPNGTLVGIGPGGARHELALSTWGPAVGVVDGQVVFAAPGGTFAVSVGGEVALVSTGSAVAAGGNRIFVQRCDEQLVCGMEVLSPDGTVLGTLPGAVSPWPAGAVSVDGRLAVLEPVPGGDLRLRVDELVLHEGSTSYVTGLAWSPDGRWLFEAREGEVLVHDLASAPVRSHELDDVTPIEWPSVVVVQVG